MAADTEQTPNGTQKARIFISYSRKDMAFADRLETVLKARGFDTLIDRTEIYAFEDWWKRIESLIVKADTIIFVLSPDAVASEICAKEVAFAASLNKRFAPLVCRRVEDSAVPKELRRLHFIFFDDPARFDTSADDLTEALRTDIDWIRQHTEFGEQARRWAVAGRPGPRGLLLRSPLLEAAERWIASRPHGAPAPTEETQAFVAESRRGASRRRNIVTGSLAAGLLVAIVLAIFAAWEWREADRQTLQAERRSALLAANISQSFTEEGAIDQALLLMLDGARVFDDASVPDQIRIALTKALQRSERIETRTLFPNMQVFDSGDALLLVDPATQNIWKLTDSIDPKLLVIGLQADKPITKLQKTQNGSDYIVLRADLDVERIDAATGARRTFRIPNPPEMAGVNYKPDETTITDDGLVVRDFSIDRDPATSNAGASQPIAYHQIFDAETWQLMEGSSSGNIGILRKRPDGGVYVEDTNGGIRIVVGSSGGRLVEKSTKLSDPDRIYALYGPCVGGMSEATKPAAINQLKEAVRSKEIVCRKFGQNYLISYFIWGPVGTIAYRRSDLIEADGKVIDLRKALANASNGNVADGDFSWVGIDPGLAVVGIVTNRTASVLSDLQTNLGEIGWSLLLNDRHPTFVTFGHFIDGNRLVVAEGRPGRVVAHIFGSQAEGDLFEHPTNEGDTHVSVLHAGNCSSYQGAPDSFQMPDGIKLAINKEKLELDVFGPKNIVIPLAGVGNSGGQFDPIEDACIQFSGDWRRMLIVREAGVEVYELKRILQTGQLAGHQIGSISLSNVSSAFFVDPAGDRIITADRTNEVLSWTEGSDAAWKSTGIYTGDRPIIYAEPDATGTRLIVFEDSGGNFVHGMLYALQPRQVWYDLGTEYKYLGATFTDKSEIAVSGARWQKIITLPSLSALVSLADRALSSDCRSSAGEEYRRSPCWPSSYR